MRPLLRLLLGPPPFMLEPYHLLLDLLHADLLPDQLGLGLCPDAPEADATWILTSISIDFPASYSPCAINT